MLSHPRKCNESLTCCIPDSCFIAKIVPMSIKMMYIVFFMIDKRLEYLLITNYWSHLTKNDKIPEKFLLTAAPHLSSACRLHRRLRAGSELQGKTLKNSKSYMHFLSEQEKRIKAVLLWHLKQVLFFPHFCQYNAGLKFFVQRKKASIRSLIGMSLEWAAYSREDLSWDQRGTS